MPLRLLSWLPAFVFLFCVQKAECRLNAPFPNPVGNGSLFCYASVSNGKIDSNGSITTYVYNAAGDLSQKLEDGMLTYFLGKEKREDGSTLYFYEKKPGGNVSRITEAAGEPGVLTEERVSADGRSGKIRYLMEENAVEVGGMKFYKKLKQEK